MLRCFQKNKFSSSVKLLFFTSAIIFHFTLVAYYFYPALALSKHPIEIDDAYAYIHKAEKLGKCISPSSCAAYSSLLTQSKNSQSDQWMRDRFDGRLFCNYTPVHSLLLKSFNSIAGDWNVSYSLLVVFGIALISLAASGLAWIWGGPLAAGIFLFSFASLKYPGAGWQYIVPTNISLAFAILAWIFSLKDRLGLLPILFFTAASLGIHPIGLVYCLPTLLVLFFRKDRVQFLKSAGSIVAVVLLVKGIGKFLEPADISCSFGAHFGWDKLNWVIAWDIFGRWIKSQGGGYASALGLVLIGIYFLPNAKRIYAILIAFSLCFLYLVSPFHILPGYAAELSQRLLLPLGLVLLGIQSHAIAYMLEKWLKMALQFKRKNFLKVFLLGIFFLALLLDRGRMMKVGLLGNFEEWNSLHYWRELISANRTVYWSPDQTRILLENSKAGEEIVYNHEVGLYHHLAYGANDRSALFLPYFRKDQKPKNLARTHSLFVLSNPVAGKDLSISPLKIIATEAKNTEWQVLAENRSFYPSFLEIQIGSKQPLKIEIDGRSKEWILIPGVDQRKELLTISKTKEHVFVLGIKTSPHQASFWPWGQKILLDHDSRPHELDLKKSFCEIDCNHEFELLSDEGSGLILRAKN